jgi:hypothetical protein
VESVRTSAHGAAVRANEIPARARIIAVLSMPSFIARASIEKENPERARVPPIQGIDGLCPRPQNQNDYEIGHTRRMLTTPSRAMADRCPM